MKIIAALPNAGLPAMVRFCSVAGASFHAVQYTLVQLEISKPYATQKQHMQHNFRLDVTICFE